MRVTGAGYGRSHVYQQGEGRQYNIAGDYIVGSEPLPWLGTPDEWPRISTLDPLEVGVHRAAVSGGTALPPYCLRDVEAELERLVAEQGQSEVGMAVLLIGDSTSGKSRMAYELLVRHFGKLRALLPEDNAELRQGASALANTTERCILWLDDLERFVGTDGLSPGLLRFALRRRHIVMATIRSERFRRLNPYFSEREVESHDHADVARGLFDIFMQFHVSRIWSEEERARAAQMGDDRLQQALKDPRIGVSEYLAAGPAMMQALEVATGPGGNPRGVALVRCAIDLSRAGLFSGVPKQLLQLLHEDYLQALGGDLLSPEPFESALSWALARRLGVTSLLRQAGGPDRYLPFDYLVDAVERAAHAPWQAPESLWETVERLATSGEEASSDDIAFAALGHGQALRAERIWSARRQAGDDLATEHLGMLYAGQGRMPEAAEYLTEAAGKGSPTAAFRLGIFHEDQGDVQSAEQAFKLATSRGDTHAAAHLAFLLQARGDIREAEALFRSSLEVEEEAQAGLGRLLAETGRTDEALQTLRAFADRGSISARLSLGALLAEDEQYDEAAAVWESCVQETELAAFNLAMLYLRREKLLEAKRWFDLAKARGYEDDAFEGALYAEEKDFEKAEAPLRRAVEQGRAGAVQNLMLLLNDTQRRSEAIEVGRAHAEKGEKVHGLLGRLLIEDGDADAARRVWQDGVEHGEPSSAYELAVLYRQQERTSEAEEMLHLSAEGGQDLAACELGKLLWDRGDRALAEVWLLKAESQGHAHASCLLGSFHLEVGAEELAEKHWRRAVDRGHLDAAQRLARLLAKQGKPGEAAHWRRRGQGVLQGKAGRKARKKRKRR